MESFQMEHQRLTERDVPKEVEATRTEARTDREGRSDDGSARACQVNLIRAGLLAEARLAEVLRPFGLNGSTFNVLMVVGGAGEPLSPCTISERTVVPRNTLTHILDVLERDGLVRRERHPNHRGMLLVELTEKGRDARSEILPRLRAMEAEWWSGFSEPDRQVFISLLGRAQSALAERS